MTENKRIAVVRVRGKVHVRQDIEETLNLLNLNQVNHCTVIDDRKEYKGMINKVNDYVAWGELNSETFVKLLETRGKISGGGPVTPEYLKENTEYATISEFSNAFTEFKTEIKDVKGLKPVFRLNPPKKGYERGGIKHPYSTGGALGYRGEKINELIERMI